jgi:MFS family permease
MAFWVVAAAFCVNLAFSAVPTPLYVIYQHRDHFSTLMITVVYAVYAIGVIASLFLGGHVSDWVGRRRVLVPALGVNVLSAALFLAFPSLAGLIVARVVSGVSIGLTTGTATAYLAELHLGAGGSPVGRRPQVVATAANLGGIGIGPLGAGLLAQFVRSPLVVPYLVFGGALVVLTGLIAISPETLTRPDPRPTWRPQRVAIPAHARGTFFAATAAAARAQIASSRRRFPATSSGPGRHCHAATRVVVLIGTSGGDPGLQAGEEVAAPRSRAMIVP